MTSEKTKGSFRLVGTSATVVGAAMIAVVAGFTPDAVATSPPASNPHLRVPQDTVSFATQILPIFQKRCAKCHGGEDENGEVLTEVSLSLLEYERVMVGSEFGTVVEAGDPDGSFLIDMITAGDMPPEGEGDKVPEEEIALIRTWIEQGALNN